MSVLLWRLAEHIQIAVTPGQKDIESCISNDISWLQVEICKHLAAVDRLHPLNQTMLDATAAVIVTRSPSGASDALLQRDEASDFNSFLCGSIGGSFSRHKYSINADSGYCDCLCWSHCNICPRLLALQQHPVYQHEVGLVSPLLPANLGHLVPPRMKYLEAVGSAASEAATSSSMLQLPQVRSGRTTQPTCEPSKKIRGLWDELKKILPSMLPADLQVCTYRCR